MPGGLDSWDPLVKWIATWVYPYRLPTPNLGASSPSDPSGTGNQVFLNENWMENGESVSYIHLISKESIKLFCQQSVVLFDIIVEEKTT